MKALLTRVTLARDMPLAVYLRVVAYPVRSTAARPSVSVLQPSCSGQGKATQTAGVHELLASSLPILPTGRPDWKDITLVRNVPPRCDFNLARPAAVRQAHCPAVCRPARFKGLPSKGTSRCPKITNHASAVDLNQSGGSKPFAGRTWQEFITN